MDIMHAILRDDPLPMTTSSPLELVVRRCLEKLPGSALPERRGTGFCAAAGKGRDFRGFRAELLHRRRPPVCQYKR